MSENPLKPARAPDTAPKPSGSQRRRVTERIAINCTPAQKSAIKEKADAAGLSPSAICLAILLDAPLPHRRQPTVNEAAMTAFLGRIATMSDALRDQTAALGKPGSNLNQVAHMLNANAAPQRIINITESAIEEVRALVATFQAAAEDMKELRTMGMGALGFERNRRES